MTHELMQRRPSVKRGERRVPVFVLMARCATALRSRRSCERTSRTLLVALRRRRRRRRLRSELRLTSDRCGGLSLRSLEHRRHSCCHLVDASVLGSAVSTCADRRTTVVLAAIWTAAVCDCSGRSCRLEALSPPSAAATAAGQRTDAGGRQRQHQAPMLPMSYARNGFRFSLTCRQAACLQLQPLTSQPHASSSLPPPKKAAGDKGLVRSAGRRVASSAAHHWGRHCHGDTTTSIQRNAAIVVST